MIDRLRASTRTQTTLACLAYLGVSVLLTWPLARHLGRDVAWDLGDSVLNIWILAWDVEKFRSLLGGDLHAFASFFDANIFHPATLTLAYSEHLIPQALLALPVALAGGNPVLCYNVVFLSTFVLSGLGMFLLVRRVTGHALAAFVGGLLFAFAPYRIPQFSHLQVLSAQWMPFTLLGVRSYVETRRRWPLLAGGLALVLQNLSCVYYLLYFPPFVAAYVCWELARTGLWRERSTWFDLAFTSALVFTLTVPLLVPYALVRADLQFTRSLADVQRMSADVYSYLTASAAQRFWGDRLAQVFPKPEGELFPGLVTPLLAMIGLGAALRSAFTAVPAAKPAAPAWTRIIALVAGGLCVAHLAAALLTVVERRIVIDLGVTTLRLGNVTQLLVRGVVAGALCLLVSATARVRAARIARTDAAFLAVGWLAAVWLSFGPTPGVLGRPLDLASPFLALWTYVPGFDGLRVPARFAMVATLMLSMLGALGASALARSGAGRVVLLVLTLGFLYEAGAAPFTVNGMTALTDYVTPEGRLYQGAATPAVYRAVEALPAAAVLAELPLGQPDYDLRAMFYSTQHWRRLVNGYSGYFPPHYGRIMLALTQLSRHPDLSLSELRAIGTTHALVHEGAFLDREGVDTTAALRRLGATELFRSGSDVLLALP